MPIFLFISMFAIIDSIWMVRNYKVSNEFIPLQSEWETTAHFDNYRLFLKSFGGDAVEWNPNTTGMWFQSPDYLEESGFKRPSDEVFPEKIFSSSFNLDSLKQLRQIYWNASNDSLSLAERKYNSDLFVNKTNKFILQYKTKSPFDYYVGSRLIFLRKFIFHPYTYYLPLTNDSYIQLGIKMMIYVINVFVIIIGLICLLWSTFVKMLKKEFGLSDMLLITIPLFLIALFPIYFGFVEYRFILLGFPFLAYYATLFLTMSIKKIVKM